MALSSSSSSAAEHTAGIPFGYHIYDLSRGIGQRFGAALLGAPLPQGVLHAGIVIFGYEYFFEGGISKRAAGCTRFGKNFSFVPAPSPATAVSNDYEFDCWLRFMEMNRWGALAYHLTEHNCIHFVDHATRFLTRGKVPAPDLIRHNMAPLQTSDIGRLLADVSMIMSAGSMMKPAEEMHQRRICRVQAAHVRRIIQGSALKPVRIFAFGPSARGDLDDSDAQVRRLVELAKRAVNDVFAPEKIAEREISVERLCELITYAGAPMQMISMAATTATMSSSSSSSESRKTNISEACTLSIAVAQAFLSPALCSSFDSLSLLMSLFSRLLLHEAFVHCVACDLLYRQVFHRLGKTFFCAMPISLKAQVLEIYCNIMSHPLAAAPMARLQRTWLPTLVFLISRALLEPSSWLVVHRASALLLNFVHAHVTCNRNAIDAEVLSRGAAQHPVLRVFGAAWFVAGHVVPNVVPAVESNKTAAAAVAVAVSSDQELDEFVTACQTPEGSCQLNFEREKAKLHVALSAAVATAEPPVPEENAKHEPKGAAVAAAHPCPASDHSPPLKKPSSGRSRKGNISAVQEIQAVSHEVLSNILEAMLMFALQGHTTNKFVQQHKMAVGMDALLQKTAPGSEARAAAQGLQLIG